MDRDEIDDDVLGQLDYEDTLDDSRPEDPLDEGISPRERPLGLNEWGTTAREELTHESLDRRLAREVPDIGLTADGDGLGDSSDTDGELIDDEVGDNRAGRIAEGEEDSYGTDVGVDGAGASAEEAAVHIVPESD